MSRDEITELVYSSCSLLDEERFDEWLALCADDFSYVITTHSDELASNMTWMSQDKAGMSHILKNVRNHARYTGRLRRHVTMPRIAFVEEGKAAVQSAFAVYHTETNGVSQLYAIGSYRDEIQAFAKQLLLTKREVLLETRRLPFGSHVPV